VYIQRGLHFVICHSLSLPLFVCFVAVDVTVVFASVRVRVSFPLFFAGANCNFKSRCAALALVTLKWRLSKSKSNWDQAKKKWQHKQKQDTYT